MRLANPAIVVTLLLTACAAQKGAKNAPPKPEWLTSRPADNSYYIGIGQSRKDPSINYIQAARKEALDGLISEIKVNISSVSTLSTIDRNQQFQEEYRSIIQTSVADEIEEYEMAGTWEDNENYWVYYRLSKMRYAQIKEEQKRNAVTLSLDFLRKAKESERAGHRMEAVAFYVKALQSIEKYLGEAIRLDFEGTEILLGNEIYASMQRMLEKISIRANPSEIFLNRRINAGTQSVMLSVTDKDSGGPIPDAPLRATFEKGSGDVFPDYKTDLSGQARMLLTKITSRDLEQSVGIVLNLDSFSGEDVSAVSKLVISRLKAPSAKVILKVQRPVVYLTADEKNFGKPKSGEQLTNKLKNILATAGFEFTDDRQSAELLLHLNSDTEKGSVSGSIFITMLTCTIRVTDAKQGKEIYTTTIDRLKGYSLDYERASLDAYTKALEALEKEKMPELINSVIQ
jgi:hypothetical protein